MGFFENFWCQLGKWSKETFGPAYIRGPLGPINHLEEEIQEIKNAPHDLEKYIDALFLILDAARRADFTCKEFMTAAFDKLEKNKKRQWPDWHKADPNKVIEHVRDNKKLNTIIYCPTLIHYEDETSSCTRELGHAGECQL